MSLTLLPAVDVRDGKAVRLRQGESGSETDYGSPLEAARTWVEAGAEWIHLVDLDAAFGTGTTVRSCVRSSMSSETRSTLRCPAACVTTTRCPPRWRPERPA